MARPVDPAETRLTMVSDEFEETDSRDKRDQSRQRIWVADCGDDCGPKDKVHMNDPNRGGHSTACRG